MTLKVKFLNSKWEYLYLLQVVVKIKSPLQNTCYNTQLNKHKINVSYCNIYSLLLITTKRNTCIIIKIIYVRIWSQKKTHPWESEKKHIVMQISMAYLYDFYCTMHPLISNENNIESELFIFEHFEIIQLTICQASKGTQCLLSLVSDGVQSSLMSSGCPRTVFIPLV